jgi:hypothetical protein
MNSSRTSSGSECVLRQMRTEAGARKGAMQADRRVLAALAVVVLLAASVSAQEASIVGTVSDESKAVLPGVTVTATNLETNAQTVAVTDERGEYRLPKLPPGPYKFQAELSGFATVVVPRVELLVGQSGVVPFTLKVASVSEVLTVTADAPFVDISTSQVTGNVNRRQMEDLPLQGRNWMELSMMVKGITTNNVTNQPGVSNDDFFQLNLDGQQITQKLAGSSFGQPAFSRDAIAEFQIVTSQFDITQGRSVGIQVQAISKSGTNTPSGSFYGFFRNDALNAPDKVAKTVLPYSDQQIGGTTGGPIVKDKMQYFFSYEYERQPSTIFTTPAGLPGESFTFPSKTIQKSLLTRVDAELSAKDRLTVRGSRWDWDNPFNLGGGGFPSTANVLGRNAINVLGTWSRVVSNNKVQQVRVGYDNFFFSQTPLSQVVGSPEIDFPGLTIGAPYNLPSVEKQTVVEGRYDLNWHKDKHDLKFGGEFLSVAHTGYWHILKNGRFTMTSVPSNLADLVPANAAFSPSEWNLAALSPYVLRFDQNFNESGWLIDVPRPTAAVWFGDNWRASDRLSINYGIRWDDDWGVFSPPNVPVTVIPISNGVSSGDFGYKTGMHDHRDFAPRVGFAYQLTPSFVVRGGSGIYYALPFSNLTYSQQVFSETVTGSFTPAGNGLCADGSLFITNPTCGVTGDQLFSGQASLPAQSPRIISPDYRNPYTWQSSIGFQKQLNAVTGFEADLTHYNEYRDGRSYDPNLYYDPATGYNVNPTTARPNPAYTQIIYYMSNGRRDQTQLATSLTRRFRSRFQAGITYTLMFAMHDDGSLGISSPSANNQFDYLKGEYATSSDFQRHTMRAYTIYQLPWGLSTSVSYFYGSGARYSASIAATPYGKPGTNRLNLLSSGAAAPAIIIPASVADRFDGPTTIPSGQVIPRNALEGLPLHKVDVRVTKDVRVVRSMKVSFIGEVYNLFNRANYGSYNTSLSATNAAQTAVFGLPTQNLGNAYVPREGQLAFRISF